MEKTKLSKIRITVASLLTLVLAGLLILNISAFTDKAENLCIGTGARSIGATNTDEPYRQYFVPSRSDLSYIAVRLATYTDENADGYIRFSLYDHANQLLSQSDVQIKDLVDDDYCRFATNVSLKTTEAYSFTLQTIDNGYDKPPMVWVTQSTGGEETVLNNAATDANSVYQTSAKFGYSYFNTAAFVVSLILTVLCGLVLALPFEVAEKYRALSGRIAILVSPIVIFAIVEELNNNSVFAKITPAYFLNYLIYLLIYLLLFSIINRLRISMILSNTLIYILGVINYYKLQFRGEPLQPWDLFSAKTAMNVSSSYTFSLSVILIISFLTFLLLNLTISRIRFSMQRIPVRLVTGALSVTLSIVLVMALFGTDRYAIAAFNVMQKLGVVNNVWNQQSNYETNGLFVALTMNAQYMNVNKPEGYSEEAVEKIKSEIEQNTLPVSPDAEAYTPASIATLTPTPSAASETTPSTTTMKYPNIIAIMCESYADLQSVADFTTSTEVMPFYDSIQENAIKGQVSVSTYGGGTANTEFEFLTGNTMAFLPTGSIPYQQYIGSAMTGSLPRILKNLGYETIAVHPFAASGWNRASVYQSFGFDSFLSQDDFTNPRYMRAYISDSSSYNKLIELYENKPKGQPIFLFNVTMQNHGGYSTEYANFQDSVKLTGLSGNYPETEQYLSLIHESDAALKNLISYFSSVDEPTVILFFGDHLPNLKNDFYSQILGKDLSSLSSEEMLKLYRTPFLLWANYDIPEREVNAISANYLSTLLLQTAGIPLPDYNQFLSGLYQEYPVISSMAVIDSAGKIYNSVSIAPDSASLGDYWKLSYNNLFDKSQRDATLFDSASSSALGGGYRILGSDPGVTVPSGQVSASSEASTEQSQSATITPAA